MDGSGADQGSGAVQGSDRLQEGHGGQDGSLLENVIVLELASYIAAPYAAALLSELGATVIKIEPPSGDPFRNWGSTTGSPFFHAYNHGKKSITLNLKHAQGRELFLQLAAGADVVIENFRPGDAERLGVAYGDVRKLHPGIVYCTVSGFGSGGPGRDLPSFDTVAQAYSGLTSLLVEPQNDGLVGPAFCDGLTGLFACNGILAALFHKLRTGQGQHVETSLLEATVAFLADSYTHHFQSGEVPGPTTRPQQAQAFVFRTSDDRRVALHLSSPEKFWTGLCAAIGAPELAANPLFHTRQARVANYLELQSTLRPIFRSRSCDEWLVALKQEGVPCAPVHSLADSLSDPVVGQLGMVNEAPNPADASMAIRWIGGAISLSGTRLRSQTPPPALGQHTAEVLASLGVSEVDLVDLREQGVV